MNLTLGTCRVLLLFLPREVIGLTRHALAENTSRAYETIKSR